MRVEIILREPIERSEIIAACAKAAGVQQGNVRLFDSREQIDWDFSGARAVIDRERRDPPGFITVEIGRKFDPADPWPSDEEASRLASIGDGPIYAWDPEFPEQDVLIEFRDGLRTGEFVFEEAADGTLHQII